jgi:hypothetical protein
LITNAQARWQTSVAALQDALRVQAGVVGNIDTNRSQTSALVTSSQSAVGALQATQARIPKGIAIGCPETSPPLPHRFAIADTRV